MATLLLALAVACAANARAQSGSASADFAEAIRRYDERDFAGAVLLFRKTWQQTKSPNARLWIARCLRELGDLPGAHRELGETFNDAARAADTDDKYIATRDAAAVERALVVRSVGQLVVVVDGAPGGGARVEIDGSAVDPASLGAPLLVAPGTVRVVATAPGRPPREQSVVVEAGRTHIVALHWEAPQAVAPAPAPPPEAPSVGLRTLGLITGGIGLAGMTVFAATALAAEAEHATLEEECGSARCADPAYTDVVDRGRALETASYAALAVGLTGLAVGIPLVIVGWPREPDAPATALRLRPDGVVLRARF